MSWSTPTAPTSGTTITVAWAVANIIDLLTWLRRMTGNADPTAANQVIISSGTTLSAWGQLPDAAMAVQKVTRAGDTMTNDLAVTRSGIGSPGSGYLYLGNTGQYVGYDGSTVVASGSTLWTDANTTNRVTTAKILDANVTTAKILDANVTTAKIADTNVTSAKLAAGVALANIGGGGMNLSTYGVAASITTALLADANVTTAKIADANVTAAKLASAVVLVPAGAVVWFATLAELTAAGAHWQRYTAADGRLLVGAGASASSQTFTEATNYGSTWTPTAGMSVTSIAAQSDGQTYLVNLGTVTTISLATHTHPSATLGGAGGVWLPYMRAGIYARCI